MSTEQKFDCVFCQDTFDDKESLQIHFRKHGDPKFDMSTKVVKNRTHNEDVPMEKVCDETEMVACDVCEEVFPTISKAITHKHKAHPDHEAKYFCSFCGKLFTMKHLLNKHTQSNHMSEEVVVSNDFHCDMCEVTFHVPSAMLYHNKFFHRQDTDIPAIGHSKKFKLFNQEMVQIYYCSFCGEEFNNKVNLHKHTIDDHSDENQRPNEVLRCPLCEAMFYHLDAYELHLTFHSSEDMYSEKNELVEQSMEFSLETVPPITENVLEEEQELPQEEDNPNPDEINNFLQLVMGEQSDNVAVEKIKHKKHKKHKKSKKASITLDEFLNMNKDVFGDGLGDVQGIEEVPTQVVLKKVKGKAQNRNEAKMVKADLAKLKKQGIIIKSKPKNNAINARNLSTQLSKQQNIVGTTGVTKNRYDLSQSSPHDILSKLMNQGNSQIKIVKKPASQSIPSVVNDAQTSNHAKEDNSILYTESECVKDITKEKTKIIENDSNNFDVKAHSEVSQATNDNSNNGNCDIEDEDLNKKNISANIKHTANECMEEETGLLENNSLDCDTIHSTQEKPFRGLSETKHSILENDIVIDRNISPVDDSKLSLDIQNNEEEIEINSSNKTISALKHLSHLITVKPLSNQGKQINKSKLIEDITTQDSLYNAETCGNKSQKSLNTEKNILNIPLKFKNQVTISSQKQSPTSVSPTVKYDLEEDGACSNNLEFNVNKKLENKDTVNLNKSIIEMKELKVELVQLPQSTYNKFSLKNQSVPSNNFVQDQETPKEEKDTSEDSSRELSNLNILKRLPNVTAKPITIPKSTNHHNIIKPLHTYATQVKGLVPKQINKGIDEDLEVYNIDDSDEDMDEDVHDKESENKRSINLPSDTLRNLSKNITVKSSETQSNPKVVERNNMRSEFYSESYTQIKNSKEIQKSINLQNKLKTLGNITVKSRNAVPNAFNIDQNKAFEEIDEQVNETDSDSEYTGKVKITELGEEYISENDLNDVHENHFIESPHASDSEPEGNQTELGDYVPDFENHIKTNMVKKDDSLISKKPIPHLENLMNLNKALTVKSINITEHERNSASQKDVSEDISNQEMAIKPYKPNLLQHEQSPNKNFQQVSRPSNQTSIKQKVNTASNQVNTVKTVKRFQSQTVIEEITTTVTKTIRTVNSSSNEIMQATTQNTPKLINKPQKLLNKQPGKELQGTTVRHASPTIGTKIRNAVPVMRTPNTGVIRPSTQPVPMRPVFNRPRCPTPSTSAIRNVITPRCSPQKPTLGKLKISPHALNQTTKRPSDETFGQLPTFKKPKDININSSDLPDCNEDLSSIKYTSASQSHTEFSNMTKNIKGKGTVTAQQSRSEFSSSSQQQTSKTMATQMRSEMCMTSQQMSKLNNMSGLKVVKTSVKQATQFEEKCEISPGQRNTLQALEKLQKQGLLVKKPRIEEYNDEANSYSESDDEIDK